MVRRVCVCACECRTRKRTTQGANQQQNSLYRFYMDDSPGLTITPLVLRFCICLIYVPISTHVLLGWNVADVFFPLSLSLSLFLQVVLIMSVGFIGFVTVLHLIGRLVQYSSKISSE